MNKVKRLISMLLAMPFCLGMAGCNRTAGTDSSEISSSVYTDTAGTDNDGIQDGSTAKRNPTGSSKNSVSTGITRADYDSLQRDPKARVTGTFIQSWLCASWSDERWAQELTALKEIGMKYIVMGDSAVKNKNGKWYSFYPSGLDGLKEGYGGRDAIGNALRNCQKFGFKVFVGISLDELWWDTFVSDPAWLNAAMTKCALIAQELYGLYYKLYPDAFYGWYWPPEIWNHGNFASTSGVRKQSIETLSAGLNIVLDALTKINPKIPMMFSPFVNITLGSARDNYLFWKDLITVTRFRKGDILVPMDSIGGGGCKLEYLDTWTKSYRQAVDETGNVLEFWSSCENFAYSTAGDPISCSVKRFAEQLQTVSKYCSTIITFAYSHYYSPNNTIEGYHNTYAAYAKTGKLETQAPSAPGNAKLTIQNDVAVITWDASTDNMGVAGYNIYRNGKLMENVCVGRRDGAGAVPVLETATTDWDVLTVVNKSGEVVYGIEAFDCAGNVSKRTTVKYSA